MVRQLRPLRYPLSARHYPKNARQVALALVVFIAAVRANGRQGHAERGAASP